MDYITFTKKSGKIQTGEVDVDTLGAEIDSVNQAYLDNEVVISNGLIERDRLKTELNKLLAIKEQLP